MLCIAAGTAAVGSRAAAITPTTTATVNAATHTFTAADLTPRQLSGQRVVCGFSGKRVPTDLLGTISRSEIAGVILFEDNIEIGRAHV